MKIKVLYKNLLFLLSLSLACPLHAFNFYSVTSDNQSTEYTFSNVRKVVIEEYEAENRGMTVYFKDGSRQPACKTLIFEAAMPTEVKQAMPDTEQVTYFIYPNPVSEMLNVSGVKEGDEIQLYDLSGRKVGTFQATDGSCGIVVREWPAGVYLIRIQDVVFRFVKN